jgi:hypothetical protein
MAYPNRAQKKWLAGAAANHLSDSPFEFPRRNENSTEPKIKSAKSKTTD